MSDGPQFAVGYRDQRRAGWGGPFAPLDEETARVALRAMLVKHPDAVLVTRPTIHHYWREADSEGK